MLLRLWHSHRKDLHQRARSTYPGPPPPPPHARAEVFNYTRVWNLTAMAGCLKIAAIIVFYASFAAALEFPSAYYAKGHIYLPYGDIAEPFEAWVDMKSGKSRMDTYNGEVGWLNDVSQVR